MKAPAWLRQASNRRVFLALASEHEAPGRANQAPGVGGRQGTQKGNLPWS